MDLSQERREAIFLAMLGDEQEENQVLASDGMIDPNWPDGTWIALDVGRSWKRDDRPGQPQGSRVLESLGEVDGYVVLFMDTAALHGLHDTTARLIKERGEDVLMTGDEPLATSERCSVFLIPSIRDD